MQIKQLIQKLEQSNEFKGWHKENKHCFLSHAFIMPDEQANGEWQLGYYDPDKNLMTSFLLGEEIKIMPETEVFKREESKVNKLENQKVKIDFKEAMSTAEEMQKSEYAEDTPTKRIVLLQNFEKLGNIWNITFLTKRMNTLNIKIDAETGKVLNKDLHSMMQYTAG